MKKYSIILVLVCSVVANAQTKQTTNVQQTWLGYFNQTRFSDKWGLWADVHLRTKEKFVTDVSQGIIRLAAVYYLQNDTRLMAGYAYINHFPADNHSGVSQPEHRPWQQLWWQTTYKRTKTLQWFRLEERFRRKIADVNTLGDGYDFNFRIRYNILAHFAITKQPFQKNAFSFVLNNEVFVNLGKKIVYNYFDQNRFFTGFAWHVTPKNSLQFGYMNQFTQLAAGNKYRSVHAARIFYFNTIDLRKPKKA